MRELYGRTIVVGTVVLIVGGLWMYASLQKVIRYERRVYFPAVQSPLPPPPPIYEVKVSSVADDRE